MRTKKIILIMPPYNRLKGLSQGAFSSGLGYLAAVLEKEGHDVRIYCCDNNGPEEVKRFDSYAGAGYWQADTMRHERFVNMFEELHGFDYVWKEAQEVIRGYAPDVVGITASTANFRAALIIARVAKELSKGVVTILGGPHATALPDEVMANSNVDFVVRGEGENTIIELMRALDHEGAVANVKGLSRRDGQVIVHNPPRDLIRDLDAIPFPARHLLMNNAGYSPEQMRELFGDIAISRGCPFSCAFCAANSVWGRQWRHRSVGNVIEEIKAVQRLYGGTHFRMQSDTISAVKQWMVEFCHAVRPLEVTWECTTRIDSIDEELLRLMKDAGCAHVHVGIESGSERILKTINKGITLAQIRQADVILNKVGMPWGTFFMIGFPDESTHEVEETYHLIRQLRPLHHKVGALAPYPGTLYYETLQKEGRLPSSLNWNWFDPRSARLSFVRSIPESQFMPLRDRIFSYVDQYNERSERRSRFRRSAAKHLRLLAKHPWRHAGELLANYAGRKRQAALR